MTGALDRIEAQMNLRLTIGSGDGPPLNNWINQDDVLALVEVAKAAQDVRARIERDDDPAWDSPSELDALDAALARLEDNQ